MTRSAVKKIPLLEVSAIIIAMLSLAYLYWDINILPGLKSSLVMNAAAAMIFLAAASSRLFFIYSLTNKKLLQPAKVLAAGTVLMGVISWLAIIFKINSFGGLFLSDQINSGSALSHMPVASAFCFILLGTALYYITLHKGEKIFLPHLLSLIILIIALLTIIEFIVFENMAEANAYYKPMSVTAAINFCLLSCSILLVNKRKGFMGEIMSEYAGGKIARLFLPMAIVVPVIISFFRFKSEDTDPYSTGLLIMVRIIILSFFIWRSAVIINRSNKVLIAEIEERKKAEETLRYRKALLEAQNDAIPDAILIVDNKGKILSYNHNFEMLWGMPQHIIDEENDTAALKFAMIQLVDPNEFIRRVNYIYAHPEETAHDEILFKDGRIIERYGNVVMGDDGTRYGWAWYFRDITQNKNYENKIKNFNKDLEIKVEERTEELYKSEKRFRLLVENSLDIISLVDADGRIFYISPSIKRLTGFAEKELIGKLGFEMLHKDDLEDGKKLRAYLINHPGVSANNAFRFLHKNGGYIWIEGTVTNMLNDENVKAFVLNYHDITERKNWEQSIRKSEKRFRSLIDNALDIISLSDENAMRFYISPAIERLTGYSIQETINQPVYNIVHPDDIEQSKKMRAEYMKDPGVIKPMSFRFLHKNGGFVWMEGTLINLLHDENVKAVVGNFHDVTERKRSEEKIRLSNERFEMVSKATHDAVWDWNLETDKIYWNDEIKSMFNYSDEDIPTGVEWKVHIHPQDFKRVTRKLIYYIKQGIQNWQDEYRFRCMDGSYKYVFNRGFILFNHDNKPYRIIGAMQDVTEINKLQQSLSDERIKRQKELTNATIEGQEKQRTEIGRELHDNINQILTATKLFLDVAATQPAIKDEMIKRSAENLSNCMEEIRKLSSSLVPPSMDDNTFDEIIKDLAEPIKLATAINITYKIDTACTNALTDTQQLNVYRIIQEHLNNILKHANAKKISINIQHKEDQIKLSIKDDGQGFDINARRKGIGFKNIQSRAELLNGKMNVISKPGEGCLLAVDFPVNNADN